DRAEVVGAAHAAHPVDDRLARRRLGPVREEEVVRSAVAADGREVRDVEFDELETARERCAVGVFDGLGEIAHLGEGVLAGVGRWRRAVGLVADLAAAVAVAVVAATTTSAAAASTTG